ncbi:MAG: DUF6167 family protein [Sporichthyaceae bacterium]
MRRLFWVAVGAAAGVYAVRKVQKTLHAYSPGGLAERATGAGAGLRAFADEVREGMAQREAELREALGMEPAHDRPLSPAEAADLIDHPAGGRAGRPRDRTRTRTRARPRRDP